MVATRRTPRKNSARGFTLVELMIAVVVVSILVAIALPSYRDHVRRGYRADAQALLMDLAQRQQQYFMDKRAYADNEDNTCLEKLGMAELPASINGKYTIACPSVTTTPPTYTISATPTGNQAGDSCGTLTITSAGAKTSSAGSNCW